MTPSTPPTVLDAGPPPSVAERIEALDWPRTAEELDAQGCALLPGLLLPRECAELVSLYPDDGRFRSRVVMAKHGFGRGEYKYFAHPLPPIVGDLRARLYERLAPIANRWAEAMRLKERYPAEHAAFLERCREAGQTRPTPLLLAYGADDYNCLHQDLYGDEVFPLQVAALLSDPHLDFAGGEFVLTEQRPRMQSRPIVLVPARGEGIVFAVRHRPVLGKRGHYRVNTRHGVSRVRSGRRYTLGLIFHDAAS